MNPFKTAEHICSWAGLCPGNNESAGKRKIYLSTWNWRIKQKKGAKKVIVALARKFLIIIYTVLKQGTLFDESCFETRRKNCELKQLSRYIQELDKIIFKGQLFKSRPFLFLLYLKKNEIYYFPE